MSTTVILPPTLRNRIAGLGRRVRLLRTVRGVSLLVLVAALTAGAALLADFWLDLPALARQVWFSAWLSLTLCTLLLGLVGPLFRRLEPVALAATVEEAYPELGERLTSTVELTSDPACAHGSPALIGLLLDETEARTGRLDFRRAVPARPAGSLGAAAGLALLLATVPALLWPQQYQRLAGRFFLPWAVPVAGAPYALEIIQDIAVPPVELAAESPTITVTPPAYARATHEAETFHGLVDLSPLAQSQARFEFRFNRPAVAASLEWVPDAAGVAGKSDNPGVRQPLVLTEDRRGASCTVTASAACTYRLVLEAEHGVLTERDGGTLTPTPDQPPLFGQLAGKEDLQAVLAYDRIPLRIDLTDDVGVAGAELEYRVNDEEPVREPVELQGANRLRATGRHVFQLAGKVKEGDTVRYRFRATDNLPKEFGGPHVVYYPADRWLMLKIVRQGAPLKEQEVREQHDEISRRLEAIKESVTREKRAVYKVRQESRYRPDLTPDQARQVEQLEEQNRASEKALRELVRDTSVSPVLQPLADRAHDVADHEMKRSEAALEKAGEKNAKAPERTAQLENADRQLASALRRLDDLKRANDRLAQDRMARAKMEALADRQKQLSERAAELAARDPVRDPSAKPQAEQLKREQGEVAAELQRLAEQSEALRQGMDEARARQARELADKARDLARAQRDLARAAEETDRKRKAEQLAEVARKQQELAEQADRLARQTRQPARAAKASPLKVADLQQAAEALKQGDPEEAIKHQDQAARDLERLADDLDRAIRKEQGEQARKLAREQRDLRNATQQAADRARAEAGAARPNPVGELAQQQARQQDLQQQAGDLRQQLNRLGHELGRTPAAQAATQQAANSTQQAQIAMRHADAQSRLGNQPLTRRARQQAAESLDRAAQQAARAPGPQTANRQGGERQAGEKAGESVKQAQGQMSRAQGQLNQGRNQGAQSAMQQAAQLLKQAAEQLARAQQQGQPGQPGQPSARGAAGGGLPDPSAFGLDRTKYAGKSWGELPGELRTRIVQDMKAKYGDDYARMIKLYFEQLADTKK